MAKKTKKTIKKNIKKKNVVKNDDLATTCLLLGMLLTFINNYSEGGLLERIIVLIGFAFTIIGALLLAKKYYKEKNAVLMALSAALALGCLAFAITLVVIHL